MITYLVTFANVFDHAKFRESYKDYFDLIDKIEITKHSSKFCTIQTKWYGQFYYQQLKKDMPKIKILLKQYHGKKLKYTKL